MKIQFTKMHGAGNDYIYVDTARYPIADPARCAIAWSRPHTGIGSDGLASSTRTARRRGCAAMPAAASASMSTNTA